ncbi:MAG: CHAP domain-containing protein [Myxococcaceae bacterium]
MVRALLVSLVGWVFAAGCATGSPVGGHSAMGLARYRPLSPPSLPRQVPESARVSSVPLATFPPGARDKVVELARGLVGKKGVLLGGKRYPDDCTGLVKGVFAQVGVNLAGEAQAGDNGVTAMYRFASAHGRVYQGGRPVPGDLVFFRETYDLNADGRANDGLTHVGLVEAVRDDGTVLVIHRVQRGVVRYRMNLAHRDARRAPGSGLPVNDTLRLPGPAHRDVLTAQLFAAYATLLPVEPRYASR